MLGGLRAREFGQMGITRRGERTGMPQNALDLTQIDPQFQQVSRIAVATMS